MFEWIGHNKELFLQTHTDIGMSYQHAADLQTQHDHFAMNSMVRRGNATRKQSFDTLSLNNMRQPSCLLVTNLMVSSSGILSLFLERICEYLAYRLSGDAALWGGSLCRPSDTADLWSAGSGLEELCLGSGGAQCHLGHVLGVPPNIWTGNNWAVWSLIVFKNKFIKIRF